VIQEAWFMQTVLAPKVLSTLLDYIRNW